MGFIGTEQEMQSGMVGDLVTDFMGDQGDFFDFWEDNPAVTEGYQSTTTGALSYDAIHPPKPDMTGTEHPTLTSAALGANTFPGAMKGIVKYWAGQVGADDYSQQDADFFASDSKYQNAFKDDLEGWRNDWGDDTAWEGNFPENASTVWKTHRGKREQTVDLPFMTEVETGFKDLETSIGYKPKSEATDLIAEVFPGYGSEINTSKLEERGNDPSIVIGDPDEVTGELDNTGELAKSDEASGAWGQYVASEKHIKQTYTQDKEDAKEDYQAELKSIKAQKKALGSGVAPGLRETVKKGTLTGLRKGGRRIGGYGRATTESLQSKSKELGGLREKARSTYNKKLERLALDKKQDIETKVNALTTKVETEFTALAGDIKVADIGYQSDHLTLEDARSGNIYDLFQMYESSDPAPPWPRDPDRTDEEE